MWKYTVIDKDGKVHTDIYQSNIQYKASEICRFLESCDFEVISLRKATLIEIAAFMFRFPPELKKNIALT